ncbi:MAG: hypothetical protein IJP56_05275, partial [Synergistaceae bacterium]|nr:hypothetical protein [Synergistaceae bacterium]
ESKDRRGVNIDAVSRNIKSRVRDVLKRRNSSFAVIMPVISVNNDYLQDESLAADRRRDKLDFFNI